MQDMPKNFADSLFPPMLFDSNFISINSQCMSSLTEVETGTERLLFVAWQVRIVWRSSLLSGASLNSLVTTPLSSSTLSETSSRRAWSRHQVTLGVGWPVRRHFCASVSSPLKAFDKSFFLKLLRSIWLSLKNVFYTS